MSEDATTPHLTMPRPLLRLLVFDPADSYDDIPPSACSIDEYLRERPAWRPDPGETFLDCGALTRHENDQLNPFGYLSDIVPLLAEASTRLARGELAVLRTCDEGAATFLRLMPGPGGTTTWTDIGSLPRPYGWYYPLADSPLFTGDGTDQRAELYGYLEGGGAGEWSRPLGAPMDTARLCEALRAQALLGARLFAYLQQ